MEATKAIRWEKSYVVASMKATKANKMVLVDFFAPG